MFESMHYDIHLARERDLFHVAEMHKAFKILKSSRRDETGKTTLFGSLWLLTYGVIKRLRQLAATITAPGHGLT